MDDFTLLFSLSFVLLLLAYLDLRNRIRNAQHQSIVISRCALKNKLDFLTNELEAVKIKLDAYISIQLEARNASLEALTKIGAMEKSTHSVQYIPQGTANDFISALKRTNDPLMDDPDVDAQLEALENRLMKAAERDIPDAI